MVLVWFFEQVYHQFRIHSRSGCGDCPGLMKSSNHYRRGKMIDWFGSDCNLVGMLALVPAAVVVVLEMFEEDALSTNDLAQRMASHYDFQLQSEMETIYAASAACRSSELNSEVARSSERKERISRCLAKFKQF